MDLSKLGGGGGFKNKAQVTVSGSWTVPAGVYEIEAWGTAGGGAGGGADSSSNPTGGSGGGGGASVGCILNVTPGDILQIVIGAGGVGAVGAPGTSGGNTLVRRGNTPILFAQGGSPGNNNFLSGGLGASNSCALNPTITVGGSGGTGAKNASAGAALAATKPIMLSRYAGGVSQVADSGNGAPGGAAGTARGPGGAGGSSMYGDGGPGQNGSNTTGAGVAGTPAPALSYGAGGGGASGATTGTVAGGNGAPGIVEIFY